MKILRYLGAIVCILLILTGLPSMFEVAKSILDAGSPAQQASSIGNLTGRLFVVLVLGYIAKRLLFEKKAANAKKD